MSKKAKFNKQWMDPEFYPEYSEWLCDVPANIHQGYCKVCLATFELSSMGMRAVESHCRTPSHLQNNSTKESKTTVTVIFVENSTTNSQPPPITDVSQITNSSQVVSLINAADLNSCLFKDDGLKAECIWAVYLIRHKLPFDSWTDADELFSFMFPDSEIAQQFRLERCKIIYDAILEADGQINVIDINKKLVSYAESSH